MTVGSVSASSVSESRETKVNGRDLKNDHDQDDAAKLASPSTPSQVNASGQQIGSLVNRSA